MENDIISLAITFLILLFVLIVFIRIAIKMRKHGGSMLTTMHGSTHAFLDEEKRKAVKEVIEQKAGTKTEEQSKDELKL